MTEFLLRFRLEVDAIAVAGCDDCSSIEESTAIILGDALVMGRKLAGFGFCPGKHIGKQGQLCDRRGTDEQDLWGCAICSAFAALDYID